MLWYSSLLAQRLSAYFGKRVRRRLRTTIFFRLNLSRILPTPAKFPTMFCHATTCA